MRVLANDRIDLFITKRVDALAINPVDRAAAGVIIDKAKRANIPVVFFNREPFADDMQKWDKVYYVGARAEESGTMSGEIIAEYWKTHPEADKNKDGVLQYVLLMGEPGHQDAELRLFAGSKFTVKPNWGKNRGCTLVPPSLSLGFSTGPCLNQGGTMNVETQTLLQVGVEKFLKN